MSNPLKIQKIREILLRDWDPFCVGENPNLADEYDNFVDSILQLIERNCTSGELAEYLSLIENKLHAPVSDDQQLKTVRSLQNIA